MTKLERLLLKYEFLPELIFNMDETMLDTTGYKVKVVFCAGTSQPYTVEEVKLKHISLVLCISVFGGYVCLLVILSQKTVPPLNSLIVSFYTLTGQPNGFIDNEI